MKKHLPAEHGSLQQSAAATGIVTMLSHIVDEFLDSAGSQLQVVANYAAGSDNINLDACTHRGITVTKYT